MHGTPAAGHASPLLSLHRGHLLSHQRQHPASLRTAQEAKLYFLTSKHSSTTGSYKLMSGPGVDGPVSFCLDSLQLHLVLGTSLNRFMNCMGPTDWQTESQLRAGGRG